jgi:hypothetical protein
LRHLSIDVDLETLYIGIITVGGYSTKLLEIGMSRGGIPCCSVAFEHGELQGILLKLENAIIGGFEQRESLDSISKESWEEDEDE